DVHDDEVGAPGAGQFDGLAAGAGLADDLHVRGRVDEHGERLPHESLVVGEQHAAGHRAPWAVGMAGVVVRGRRAVTWKPPPSRGPASRVPPTLRALSRMPVSPNPGGRPGGGPVPSSVTDRCRAPSSARRSTRTAGSGPAWRTTLVRASCTMR